MGIRNENKTDGIRQIARKYNVPRSTLMLKFKSGQAERGMGPELKLERYIEDNSGFPLTKEQFLDYVAVYLKSNNNK